MRSVLFAAALLAISGCRGGMATDTQSLAALHFAALQTLCDGQAYRGQMTSDDEVDASFAASEMIMGPAICADQTVRIPFAVGSDRSRTWVITATTAGQRLKHDHRHKDGTEDTLTQYGGDSVGPGTGQRQAYPVDAETRALFTREGIEVSNQNTWAVEVVPGDYFAYEMSRPERFFRIEFDLSEPVPAPPLPWGVEPIE